MPMLVARQALSCLSPVSLLEYWRNIECEPSAIHGSQAKVLHFVEGLMVAYRGRFIAWGPTQEIGDVILTLIPFLKMYKEYAAAYQNSVWLFGSLSLICINFVGCAFTRIVGKGE